jgi:hypothetical protein
MTASAGREVQTILLQKAQASEPCSEKVSDLGQALLCGHEVGRQGVGAGQAAVGIIASTARPHAHALLSGFALRRVA